MLQPIKSVTHAHLAYLVAAERSGSTDPIRILDAGCGNGELLLALHRHLPGLTGRPVELYGFDVSDARVQRSSFFDATLATLRNGAPEEDWSARLHLISTHDDWPFANATFDVIVSNQVLEHVSDLPHFLTNAQRVLRHDGISVNLFPTRSYIVEGHVGVPFAHWFKSDDVRRAMLTTFARLGLSKLGPMRIAGDLSPDEFGRTRAEYVATQTFYRSFAQLADVAHAAGLTASYRWTPQLYTTKIGYLTGRDTSRLYRRTPRSLALEVSTFPVLSRLSSVTICFSKSKAYDPDDDHAGHLD